MAQTAKRFLGFGYVIQVVVVFEPDGLFEFKSHHTPYVIRGGMPPAARLFLCVAADR